MAPDRMCDQSFTGPSERAVIEPETPAEAIARIGRLIAEAHDRMTYPKAAARIDWIDEVTR